MDAFRKLSLIGISVVFAAGLAGCDKPGPAETAGKSIDETAAKAGQKMGEAKEHLGEQGEKTQEAASDSAITAKVKAAIFAEPGLRSLQVNVSTTEGEVTLSGTVDSSQISDRAMEIARSIAGVKEVENKLVVNSTK